MDNRNVKPPRKVLQFVKENGFDSASFVTQWEEYQVYEAVFNNDEKEVPMIGFPQFVLYQNGKTRFTAFEEYQKISNSLR